MTVAWRKYGRVIAGLSGAMAVGFGALAAHGAGEASQASVWLEKGARYQMFHALALLALCHWPAPDQRLILLPGILFVVGMLFFSLGLYCMALLSWPIQMVIPIGGTAFILGWLALAAAAIKSG
ncbi:MAG TPA: DUF423 domain-containing protein [Rhodospirillaceae bacterium]|nr:DUF423 domain-containing protein [Rhodospirillaceae bacterium]